MSLNRGKYTLIRGCSRPARDSMLLEAYKIVRNGSAGVVGVEGAPGRGVEH